MSGNLPMPTLKLDVIREFGPHRAYAQDIRVDTGVEPDKVVKTHCCFCGQQCGMQLKVKDNTIIGVEPWYEFPFNQGMLCPKGVKRYLQQGHPDRLLHAYKKDPGAPGGFSAMGYEEAIRRVGDEITRIQERYGNNAFAILYGQVRPHGAAHLEHRLQRPALHGERGGRQQEGVRRRPLGESLDGHPRRGGDPDRRLQRGRVLADHHQLSVAGTRAGREGDRGRSAHHTDGAHLRSLPAGEAGP
jgi:hypothetical protein